MEFETVRFNELKRYLKTISDKTLSTNLKELEADKLIVRTEYPQIPPKVEYTLSERGKTLMTVLDQLCVWGEENRQRVGKAGIFEIGVLNIVLYHSLSPKIVPVIIIST